MPAPGAQHNGNVANPFEEPQKRIAEYTAQEIATLQSRLEKQLGPEYISARSGPSGQKVHYIAAEKCIALANEVFGFNGWSSSIQNIQVDFVDEHPQSMRVSLGLSVIIRVTLRDGTYHEDIGYGHIENCKGKAAAFEKAKKEGTTDALKRALRNFGNVLGNCIYDKDYLAKVTKLKPGPTKFDENRLHRHSDFAVKKEEVKGKAQQVVKRETADALDEFLDADFDEVDFAFAEEDHPDEVSLPSAVAGAANQATHSRPQGGQGISAHNMNPPPARHMGRSVSAGNLNSGAPQTPNQGAPRPGPQQGPAPGVRPAHLQQQVHQHASRANNATPPRNAAPGNGNQPIAFFSARSVPQIPGNAPNDAPTNAALPIPAGQQAFNPKAESPSIRKTPGIDHTSSKPISRDLINPTASQQKPAPGPVTATGASNAPGFASAKGPTSVAQVTPGSGAASGGLTNLQLSQTRRIGAPGGPPSPLANRTSYRPPTMVKRPMPQDGGAGRPPLAEVTNSNSTSAAGAAGGAGGAGIDSVKRQRMS